MVILPQITSKHLDNFCQLVYTLYYQPNSEGGAMGDG
jgi:hypothetical protein